MATEMGPLEARATFNASSSPKHQDKTFSFLYGKYNGDEIIWKRNILVNISYQLYSHIWFWTQKIMLPGLLWLSKIQDRSKYPFFEKILIYLRSHWQSPWCWSPWRTDWGGSSRPGPGRGRTSPPLESRHASWSTKNSSYLKFHNSSTVIISHAIWSPSIITTYIR